MARGETLLRQWQLLLTLQAYRFGITADGLAGRLECNKRTVQRDLSALQDIFPIRHEQREGNKKFWKMDSKALQAEELQLTPTEMLSLYMSQQLLLPLAGTQLGDGLQTAIQKIRTFLPDQALSYFADLNDSIFIKNLANHDYAAHSNEIRILNDAINRQQVTRVRYHSASKGEEVFSEFHPYGLVLLHASLYCLGYLACHEEVRTLKVARIKGLSCTQKTFEKPVDFSLAGQFRDAFGIFQTGHTKKQKIRAEFFGWAATNLREMQWHPSQKIVQDDREKVIATFELGSTVEFKRWLLGFGSHARIVSPKALAEEIQQELLMALEQYQPASMCS